MAHVLDSVSPIDGEPDRIESYSRYYSSIAAAITATADNLATIANSATTQSEAVTAFVEVANEVRGHLLQVDERYETLSTQLASYAAHLRTFQSQASTMMTTAHNAYADYDTTQWKVADLRDKIDTLDPTDPSITGLRYNLNQQENHLQWIESVVEAKNTELNDLITLWRNTANGIADLIDEAVDGSPLNDSGWDKFLDFLEQVVTEILPIIEMVLDILALVLTIAAFILAVTGVGAPFAAALFAIARVAQLISKVIKVVRIALTVVLIATGTLAPTALIDLALDMALDKLLGKMGDKLGDGALAALKKSPLGQMIANAADKDGAYFIIQNLDEMVDGGFDNWLENGFTEFMEVGLDGNSWASGTMDWVEAPLGKADDFFDSFLEFHGITFPPGPDFSYGGGDLKGLGWSFTETVIGDIQVGDGKVGDYINIPDLPSFGDVLNDLGRPPADALIGANS